MTASNDRGGWILAVVVAAVLTQGAAASPAADFTAGQIVEPVRCEKEPDISYAVYLPSGYREDRTWPVIWCIAPDADGVRPLQLLRAAAERYGYLLIGSLTCRNGAWEPNDRALRITRKDVEQRFAVDGKRYYGVGFSGGARIILDYAIANRRSFVGVIECGAFYTGRQELPRTPQLIMIGIVGDGDLALAEHLQGEELLTRRRYTQWLEVYAGAHHWPPESLLTEAVELFEAVELLAEEPLAAGDRELLQRLVSERIAAADRLRAGDRPLLALRKYRQTAAVLSGVTGAERAAQLARELEQAPALAPLLVEEERFVAELDGLRNPADGERYEEAARALQVRMAGTGPFSRRARNALHLSVLFVAPTGATLLQQGKLEQAKALFLASRNVYPDDPMSAYNAACACARLGDTETALLLLRDAAAHRFNDVQLLRSDTDLEPLRQLAGFAEVAGAVQQNHDQGLAPPPYPSQAVQPE